ncbi:MAG TPA: pyridoxamine 5'-phosphate oxidase [Candidatus Eisenbacteria bacterium]|nr:pyridoxamine 5'-phosphate oxidase [Candidatus Eisenbacteria bacterium]
MAVRSKPELSTTTQPWRALASLLRRARRAGHSDPVAMALATAGRSGRPTVRMVLLRGLDARGLLFFTNYGSRKGRDLAQRPRASVVFHWPEIERQVRVEGPVERLSARESDDYFASRPREARLAAWSSDQSKPLRSRATLIQRYRSMEKRFKGIDVPRPPYWGGFLLVPDAYEFWAARPHRLHDRVRLAKHAGRWRRELLAP